ncbi:hypothetical protein EV641_108163 [Rhodococcus sp. SMB37]|uniref:hypothetical protein n=1 Tax=Rhodococcus sp. SMB37 TaxID=2512213 RepID=UPI0010502A7C|nr:hypothetical protein [Rhodococcus sp. SMB37]TCN52286.1 hypothetical protein EV641_108163 [Rhodococcus sp. SMB37]
MSDRLETGQNRGWRWRPQNIGHRWITGPGWTGATALLGVVVLLLWLWRAIEQAMPGAVAVSWRISAQDLLLTAAVGSVAALMGTSAAALLKRRVPVPFLSVLVMSVLMLLTMGAGPSPVGWLVVCLIVLLTAPLLGSWIGTLIGAASGHGRRPGRRHSAAAAVALLVAAAGAATLEGVNYLTIGGSHDADVGAFAGTKQYARTGIAPGQVKAAVSIYRANHSQFNTRWGSYDAGLGLSKHLLDTEALLGARDQQQAAAVFVSAFLDATLSYDRAAMRLFETPAPDVEWLPRTDYRIAVASGDQTGVIGFADVDHSAGDVNTPGPTAGEGTAQMTALPLRTGVSDNTVLHVRPDRPGGEAAVTVDVSDSPPVPEGRVVVDLADARPHEIPGESATVEVDITDSAGRTTTCPLTGPAGLPGQMPATTVKLEALKNDATSEPTLQTHTASTDCIANGAVGLDAVEALTFRARGLSNEGLYLDNAGVAGGH